MIIQSYIDKSTRILKKIFPQLTIREIEEAIEYSIAKRYKEEPCRVENNYTKTTIESTLLQMTDWIQEHEPICTAYGVMFKKHVIDKPHPFIELVRFFMEDRDVHKKKMFKALEEHNYELAEIENLMQLLVKRDGNSLYGAMGNAACALYNLYVSASTTAQGRSIISSATLFFESFLSNNVKFGSLEEVLHFIDNICGEERKYSDRDILDKNISIEQCFVKIIMTCDDWRRGRIKWIPDEEDMQIIWDVLSRVSQEDINRIYYKNNLYKFMDNRSMRAAIIYILKALKRPYLTPNDVPEEIAVELDVLQDILREYVYYKYMYVDRIDRCVNMIKNVCVISDTDSTIVSFNRWLLYIRDIVRDEYIGVAKEEHEMVNVTHDTIETERVYDFYSQSIVERPKPIKPFILLPQDNLRFSIINIIAYIGGNLCNEYIVEYTKHSHSYQEGKKCLLYLKNEFLFSRALLTMNKKNYATNRELQEGVIIEQNIDRAMDIKGLPINKSTLNDTAKTRLQQILYDRVLTAREIVPEKIISDIAVLEKDIEDSLLSGSKEFYKPVAIKALSSYEDPMRIQGIKAAVIWNKIKDPELEAIDLDSRNTIDIVKVNITPTNIDKIKDDYPEAYERLLNLFMDTSIFKKDFIVDTIAIPKDVSTPKWIREFIDIKTITNDNITNFPFESVGITRLGADNVNYSTIMKI